MLLGLAALWTTSAQGRPQDAMPAPYGTYGDMAYSRDSGDVDGIELRIARQADEDVVEFSVGEGGCGDVQIASLSRDAGRWRFVWSYDGDPAGPRKNSYWVRREGRHLRLETDAADNRMGWLVHNPGGRLLRSVRHLHCLDARQ